MSGGQGAVGVWLALLGLSNKRDTQLSSYPLARRCAAADVLRVFYSSHVQLPLTLSGVLCLLHPRSKARNVMLSTGNADGRGIVGKVRSVLPRYSAGPLLWAVKQQAGCFPPAVQGRTLQKTQGYTYEQHIMRTRYYLPCSASVRA